MKDPKAENPAEIVVANEEYKHLSSIEARKFVEKKLDGEPQSLLLSILDQNPEGEYRVDADVQKIREWATIIKPRIRHGKLLIPKKFVSIRFANGKLHIRYLRGFSDDNVNQALHWYSKGLNPLQIARKTGMKEATLYDWLYRRMDLPRIGPDDTESKYQTTEILRLYDDEVRPKDIGGRIGCSTWAVYKALKKHRELEFGWGGPDPWVYELTGEVKTVWNLLNLDLEYSRTGKWYYDDRYKKLFTYVREFEQKKGRGPTRDELYGALGFQPWRYLQNLVRLGVFNKKKLPKEEIYTPKLLLKK